MTGLLAAPQDVDLTGPNPNPTHEYRFNLGAAIPGGTTFGVLNATGNVFWEFASIPGGATTTPTSFTLNGITVTLPGTSSTAVSNVLTATITGTPTSTTALSFTVTVSDENDPINRTRNRQYDLIINQPADFVLVLDRSGSMGAITPKGVTRWNALTTAAGNFANLLAALGRSGDRIGITYFHTNVLQPNAVRFPTPLINVDNLTLANTINTELASQSPSGLTAMGAGMKDGQGKVTDASRGRYLFLFTDGEQNQNPMVRIDGHGYSDGTALNASYPTGPGSIKVFTIGIDGPGGPDLTTLQNLANDNRGHYMGTDDGSLDVAWTNQFVNALNSNSPQLIATTNTPIKSGPVELQSFPLNQKVDKLLIQLSFSRKFEVPQLLQLLTRIQVVKDGVNMTSLARPSWVSNYTNTILITFDFKNPPSGYQGVIAPEGKWVVKLGDVSQFKITECQTTSIADDHRLDYSFNYGSTTPPLVNTTLKPTLTLSWLSNPISNANVEAVILRPGQDLGDYLANNPLNVQVSSDQDAGSPGVQKFNQLWSTDSIFRNALARQENLVKLNHTGNGKYVGEFNGLTVAGNYRIIYRISGDDPAIGKYQRYAVESFYVSFNGISLDASAVRTQIDGNTLVMTFKPKTPYGKLVGPAFGAGFTVDNPNVKIQKVVDNQDGSYTITFTGSINEQVSLSLLGQQIYKGKLSKIATGGTSGLLDRIQSWLESLGLPGWLIWIILLILAAILWLLFKKKK